MKNLVSGLLLFTLATALAACNKSSDNGNQSVDPNGGCSDLFRANYNSLYTESENMKKTPTLAMAERALKECNTFRANHANNIECQASIKPDGYTAVNTTVNSSKVYQGCAQLESAVNAEKAKIEKEKQEKEAARATQEPSEPKDPRDEKLVKDLTFTDINGKVKSLRELERAAGSQDQIIQDGKVKLTSAMNPNDVICAVSEIERGKLTSRESLKCVSISTTDKQGSARVSMTFISDKSGIMFEVLCGSPKHTSETMTFKALRKEIGSIIEL